MKTKISPEDLQNLNIARDKLNRIWGNNLINEKIREYERMEMGHLIRTTLARYGYDNSYVITPNGEIIKRDKYYGN